MNILATILVLAIVAVFVAWLIACIGNILGWWNV